jgi:hypothetical protein
MNLGVGRMKIGTSNFGSRSPRHVREDMQELSKIGFTHVLHTVSEDDKEYYMESMKEIVDQPSGGSEGLCISVFGSVVRRCLNLLRIILRKARSILRESGSRAHA